MLSRRQFLRAAVAGMAMALPPVDPGRLATIGRVPEGVSREPSMAASRTLDLRPADVAATYPGAALPNPTELYVYLDRSVRRLTTPDPTEFGPIGTRGRAIAWNWSYWGRALVFGYRATGQVRFLDRFVAGFSDILHQRDDRLGLVDAARRRVIPGWGSDLGGVHLNEVAVAGLAILPVCEFLLLFRDERELALRYPGLAAAYLDVASEVAWQFEADYRLSSAGGHYVHPLDHCVEPLNHTHALGAAFAHLAAITGEARYRAKVDEIAACFVASARWERNESWSWPYVGAPGCGPTAPAEPVWKAGTTMEFPIAALRHGSAFVDRADILARSLTQNILRATGINEWVTSQRTQLLDDRYAGTTLPGAALAPWFLMPDRSGHVAALLAAMDRQPALFAHRWLGGARGLSMAAAWLLANSAPRKPADARPDRLDRGVRRPWRGQA